MEELFTYFASSTAIIAALMSGIKRMNFIKKEWYQGIAISLTVVIVAIMTVLVGWNFGVFFGGLLAVFISEYGLDKKVFSPVLKKLLG